MFELAEAERRVRADVRQAYRAWLRSAASVELEGRSVGLAEKQVRLATLRYERGIASNFDVVEAENTLLQAEASLISARLDRVIAGLQLRRACGRLDPREFEG